MEKVQVAIRAYIAYPHQYNANLHTRAVYGRPLINEEELLELKERLLIMDVDPERIGKTAANHWKGRARTLVLSGPSMHDLEQALSAFRKNGGDLSDMREADVNQENISYETLEVLKANLKIKEAELKAFIAANEWKGKKGTITFTATSLPLLEKMLAVFVKNEGDLDKITEVYMGGKKGKELLSSETLKALKRSLLPPSSSITPFPYSSSPHSSLSISHSMQKCRWSTFLSLPRGERVGFRVSSRTLLRQKAYS